MASAYGSMSLNALKAELRQRNARVAGRKAELVERLEAYDRNRNFGACDVSQPEFHMTLPAETNYKDLHGDMSMPQLTVGDLSAYLRTVHKEMDAKPVRLYDNSYVNFIRCCDQDVGTYVKAQVRAEMKAHLCYRVDILLANALIAQCQCECAAGMGPAAHCKHVICVLYGLTEFANTKQFRTATTCTQQLQTFHQPKKLVGSPVKAVDLQLSVSDSLDFDPRPPEFRSKNSYTDYFRNMLINSQVFSQAAVMHAFAPANPYAIDLDHDYLLHSLSHNFLVKSGLVTISQEEITSIEETTRHDKKAWRRERSMRICSSSFGLVCKATDRTDKRALAQRLVCSKEFRSKATDHGKMLEGVAVRKYEELSGAATTDMGLLVSAQHPYLASTPDRKVNDQLLVEVKCPYSARNKAIDPSTVPYLEDVGCKLKLKMTHEYYFQIQGQMFCSGACSVDFVVYTFQDIKVIRVERDQDFISNMIAKLKAFHDDYHRAAVLEQYFFRRYSQSFAQVSTAFVTV